MRQQREVLDRLPVAELGVDAVDRPLDLCPQRGLIEALALRRVRIGNDERSDVRPRLAQHHGAGDKRIAQQFMLELHRRNVFAACGLEKRFLPVGDFQEPVAVDLTDIAGVEPAVLQHLGGGLGLVVVREHVARPFDEDLAIVGDLQLNTFERLADGEELVRVQGVRAHAGRGLGQAPTVQDRHPQRPEELLDLPGQCGAATDEEAQAPACKKRPYVAQHETISEAALGFQEWTGVLRL